MLEKLGSREREIVHLLAGGASNPAMAETLRISAHTVKDHIRGPYSKLGVDNRVQPSASFGGRRCPHSRRAISHGGPSRAAVRRCGDAPRHTVRG
ncbi:response regulator transcription factor [Streptomyces sp. NPDC096094]|uniref:response regulator transcription factor n=1 Tax=Streptomyces sp. NPDC096094 TaxID=3366073 RepID=UPI003801E119